MLKKVFFMKNALKKNMFPRQIKQKQDYFFFFFEKMAKCFSVFRVLGSNDRGKKNTFFFTYFNSMDQNVSKNV